MFFGSSGGGAGVAAGAVVVVGGGGACSSFLLQAETTMRAPRVNVRKFVMPGCLHTSILTS